MALGAAPLPSLGLLFETSNAEPGLFYVIGPRRYGTDPFPVTHATFLLVGRKLVAEHGTFTLSGQDATLTKGAVTPLAVAAPLPSLALALNPAAGYMYGATGFITVNGQAATFRKGRALVAETGYFTVEGAPAERDLELDAETGYISLTGQLAGLALVRTLTAAVGTFDLTGGRAGLTIEDALNRRLSADVGLFVLSGQDVGPRQLTMVCGTGAFSILGGSPILDGPFWSQVEADNDTTWDDVAETAATWTDA